VSLLLTWQRASVEKQGNIILTDHTFNVLTLLRSHRDDAAGLAVMSRHVYPLEASRAFARAPEGAVVAALTAAQPAPQAPEAAAKDEKQKAEGEAAGEEEEEAGAAAAPAAPAAPPARAAGGKKRGGGGASSVRTSRDALNDILPYGAHTPTHTHTPTLKTALPRHHTQHAPPDTRQKLTHLAPIHLHVCANRIAFLCVAGPGLVDHCLASAGVSPAAPLPLDAAAASAVASAVVSLEDWFESTHSATSVLSESGAHLRAAASAASAALPRGYIRARHAPGAAPVAADTDVPRGAMLYEDFCPLAPAAPAAADAASSASSAPVFSLIEHPTFDAAVDAFFSAAEAQRGVASRAAAEAAVLGKVARMRDDQAARAGALEADADAQEAKATLIEYNLEKVDAALAAVRPFCVGFAFLRCTLC
jgi:hypothetical protein